MAINFDKMKEEYKSLLDYKKSLRDWHYDPMLPSVDCFYVGRFMVNFQEHLKGVDWGMPEHGVDLWPEDEKKPMDLHNLSWGKKDNIRAGYTKQNTQKYQLYNDKRIPKILYDIAEMTGLENYSLALFRQDPGQSNPWHFDTCRGVVEKYRKQGIELTDKDIKRIKRYLIVLEDWDWGHFLQVGNNVLSQWHAGDVYTWEYGMYHTSCNAGIKPKLTAHITGLPNEEALHLSGKYKFFVK
jgi:hypothetical protein